MERIQLDYQIVSVAYEIIHNNELFRILDLLNALDDTYIQDNELFCVVKTFFNNLCITFGKTFTNAYIRPIFENNIKNLTQQLATVHQNNLNFAVVPIYLATVLNYCDDPEEILCTLRKFLFAIPLCGKPILSLVISVKELCNINMQDTVLNCLWEGVVHQQPIVRANTGYLFGTIVPLCNSNLLYAKVVPALVTLANDPDM